MGGGSGRGLAPARGSITKHITVCFNIWRGIICIAHSLFKPLYIIGAHDL
jgi:hypothetical protein